MQQYALADLNQINSKEWASGGQNRRICPNCGDSKPHDKNHATFIYDPETGKYECKRCGARGTLIDFWESIAKCPYCGTLAEGIQRAEIWKQWKAAGRIEADRAKVEEAADQVSGLAIDEQTGAWNCRSCNATGQLRNYSGKGTARRASYTDRKADQEREKARAIVAALTTGAAELPDPTDAEWLAVWEDALPIDWAGGLEYMQFRGIGYETGRDAGVRFSECWGQSEKWAGHPAILFPFRDRPGHLVAVAARYIDPPKWGAPHRTYGAKGQGVFITGPDVWTSETVAITEAPIDALAIAFWFGVPAIACGGTSWPDWLPAAMMFKRVFLASDNDVAGDRMAEGLGAALMLFTQKIERVKPEGAKDWGELAQAWAAIEPETRATWDDSRAQIDRYGMRFNPDMFGIAF